MFALCTKHKLSRACVDFGCWCSLCLASLQKLGSCDWRSSVSQTYQAAGTASFLYGSNILQSFTCIHPVKAKVQLQYSWRKCLCLLCACYTSGCSLAKPVLAVRQQHVQHVLHVQTDRCPIGNSCSDILSLWSGEVCTQRDLTQRAVGQRGFHTSTLILSFGTHWSDIHCGVEDEPISHKELYLVNTNSVSAIT